MAARQVVAGAASRAAARPQAGVGRPGPWPGLVANPQGVAGRRTTGDGVDGFTLDRDIGAFVLTHPQLRLHQRVPLIFGSRNEVDRIERYHRGQATAQEPAIGDSLFSSRSLFRSP